MASQGDRPGSNSGWVGMASVGFEFVAAVLIAGGIGWGLDRWLATQPWIMLAGGLIGFVAGFRILLRSVNAKSKR